MVDAYAINGAVMAYESEESTGRGYEWEKGWTAFLDDLRLPAGVVELPGVGRARWIDSGGTGDAGYIIFQVNDQYFRKEGFTSSFDGEVWDGFLAEVKPVDRIITTYRKV